MILKNRANNNFFLIHLPTVIGMMLLINSCAFQICPIAIQKKNTSYYSNKAIFLYLTTKNILLDDIVGKGRIKLDSNLIVRDSLVILGKRYYNEPMTSTFLKKLGKIKQLKLSIPDSLANIFIYAEKDSDYEHDYAIIHQFSPLLPTIEKDIYLMEHYIWMNFCDEKTCVRALDRYYISFKIKANQVSINEKFPYYNKPDFKGFGPFSRKKMDEALPGEKILKFRL